MICISNRQLDKAKDNEMIAQLAGGGFLSADGQAVREDLTEDQFKDANAIINRFSK